MFFFLNFYKIPFIYTKQFLMPSKKMVVMNWGFTVFIFRCFQFFLGVRWFVVWLCIFGFVEGAAVNGIVNIILTTLEFRYNLQSSQSALIVSSTDIGALIFVLFVSYMGAKGNRPRWIAGGSLIMAVGSFIFIIPHMLSEEYNWLGQGRWLIDYLLIVTILLEPRWSSWLEFHSEWFQYKVCQFDCWSFVIFSRCFGSLHQQTLTTQIKKWKLLTG